MWGHQTAVSVHSPVRAGGGADSATSVFPLWRQHVTCWPRKPGEARRAAPRTLPAAPGRTQAEGSRSQKLCQFALLNDEEIRIPDLENVYEWYAQIAFLTLQLKRKGQFVVSPERCSPRWLSRPPAPARARFSAAARTPRLGCGSRFVTLGLRPRALRAPAFGAPSAVEPRRDSSRVPSLQLGFRALPLRALDGQRLAVPCGRNTGRAGGAPVAPARQLLAEPMLLI